jgi:hypothetical protein
MSTIGNLIQRTFRTYLYPPDYQPPMVKTTGVVSAGSTTLVLDTDLFQVPEDIELLRVGTLLEMDQELMRVLSFNGVATVTVDRGRYGTTDSLHVAGTEMLLSPAFARRSVFEAIRDNIISIGTELFTTRTKLVVPVDGTAAPIDDDLAYVVEECWPNDWIGERGYQGRIVEYHPNVGGRAVMSGIAGAFWVRYKRRTGVATSESDLLEDLGVEMVWEQIVMAGAAADLFIGRDLPASLVEWLGGVLQAENIPVGTRTQLAGALRTYRDRLLKDFAKEMQMEHRKTIRMRGPFDAAPAR